MVRHALAIPTADSAILDAVHAALVVRALAVAARGLAMRRRRAGIAPLIAELLSCRNSGHTVDQQRAVAPETLPFVLTEITDPTVSRASLARLVHTARPIAAIALPAVLDARCARFLSLTLAVATPRLARTVRAVPGAPPGAYKKLVGNAPGTGHKLGPQAPVAGRHFRAKRIRRETVGIRPIALQTSVKTAVNEHQFTIVADVDFPGMTPFTVSFARAKAALAIRVGASTAATVLAGCLARRRPVGTCYQLVAVTVLAVGLARAKRLGLALGVGPDALATVQALILEHPLAIVADADVGTAAVLAVLPRAIVRTGPKRRPENKRGQQQTNQVVLTDPRAVHCTTSSPAK